MNHNYKAIRQKAIKWLDSDRDFDKGVKILGEAQYKPVALSNCIRRGASHKFGRDKLLALMYEYIRLYASPDLEKEDDQPDDDYQQDPVIPQKSEAELEEELKANGYPKDIRRAIHEFYALMKERRALHLAAASIQGNTDEEIQKRNELFEKVEQHSRRMDKLWAAKELFEKTGDFPNDLFTVNVAVPVAEPNKIELPDDVEELKKLKKNTNCKLTRSRNQLLYQQETKADKENPIPEGPRRAKYEKKIKQLTELNKQIDYKLVQLQDAV